MEILKGLPVAESINEKLIAQLENFEGAVPHLAIIRVGEKPDDMSYEGAVQQKRWIRLASDAHPLCLTQI